MHRTPSPQLAGASACSGAGRRRARTSILAAIVSASLVLAACAGGADAPAAVSDGGSGTAAASPSSGDGAAEGSPVTKGGDEVEAVMDFQKLIAIHDALDHIVHIHGALRVFRQHRVHGLIRV